MSKISKNAEIFIPKKEVSQMEQLRAEIKEFPTKWVKEAKLPKIITDMIQFVLQGYPFLFPTEDLKVPTLRSLMKYCELLVMAEYSSGEDLALCLNVVSKLMQSHKDHEEAHEILEKTFNELMRKRMNFPDEVPLRVIT